ncbi:heterogeneous nuclear ribonucleoprotein 1-like [Actinidia eriantha]|uniref:heterogeneous nuclear ribonucleoprotein 1-like n=1 Tax=Actinidia eriantha TaxID=165200 RepID=UPI002583440F|nr:heterogeneous nuclear ribonucleoprotein 1-like [Actinidia eriantha]
MDSDEGKLFVGGISWETTEDKLRDHFGHYGDVTQIVIMHDKATGRPRGFGFVVFADPSVLDTVLQDKHTIDGRTVDAKRALSREEQRTSSTPGNPYAGRSSGSAVNYRTKKIFVGGLPSTLTEDEFREYFENYGIVTDVVIMYDQNTQRPRGFGFITFDTEDAVDRVLHKNFHDLSNKLVEVKPALPKEANPGGGGRGGGYQSYGNGANAGSFDSQIDTNRFMQPQTAGGAYPSYPSYGGPNFGYGAANSAVAYSGYGVYGSANSGFPGPVGAYGNPTHPNTGYVSGPPGVLRNPWSGLIPGYTASGYSANTGYGAPVPWSAPGSGGAFPAPMGLSPGGASGYGPSNYGKNDGSYTDSVGYGTGGGGRAGGTPNSNTTGEQQGTGGGYRGSGHGNSNGSSEYSNAGWRSDS